MKAKVKLTRIDRLPNDKELYVNENDEYYICGSRAENDNELGWPGDKIQTVKVSLIIEDVTDVNFLAGVMEKSIKDGDMINVNEV